MSDLAREAEPATNAEPAAPPTPPTPESAAPSAPAPPSADEAPTLAAPTGADVPEEASTDDAAADADARPTGRKRRRKKKTKPEGPPAPFAHLFQGAAGRRHAFAVGEVVAGRVTSVEQGVVSVDLFGKATAFADVHEPREIPVPLPPEPAPEPTVVPAADATSADSAVTAEGSTPTADSSFDSETTPEAEPAGVAGAFEEPAVAASDDGSDDAELEPHGPLAPLPVVSEAHERLEPPTLGHIFRGRVGATAESGHIVVVNRNVDVVEARAMLERCREQRRRVVGLVYGFNRGGFDVLVGGLRAFCPARAMSLEPIENPEEFLGRELEFLIPAAQRIERDVVIGRRSILEREQRKRARELLRALSPGQRVKGRVTQVLDFGLVVDLGGAEGLVHQSELSWAHGVRPADVAKLGDEVEAQVLRVGDAPGRPGGRRERLPRLSLSLKALEPDPWGEHAATLKEGSIHAGTITRLTEFGAFVQLAPAIEGLLHVSELGRDVRHPSDVLKEGEELPVVVERIDPGTRRISLSKPSASEVEDWKAGKLDASEAPKQLRPGARIKVRIEKTEHHGLIVRVAGAVGRRARGFISKADLAGGRDGDHRKAYPTGSEIEVKVVAFGRDGGLKCSVKALEIDDERRAVKDYRREASKQGFGTFGDLLRAKLGEGAK